MNALADVSVALFVLLAVAGADESDVNLEHTKRGVATAPSALNALTGAHQKSPQYAYTAFRVQQQQQQQLQPQPQYQTQQLLQPQQQQIADQTLPFQLVQFPFLAQPRIQIVAAKGANGQTHLMLLPQPQAPAQTFYPGFQLQPAVPFGHNQNQAVYVIGQMPQQAAYGYSAPYASPLRQPYDYQQAGAQLVYPPTVPSGYDKTNKAEELSLNTNEYVSQAESQFRPVSSYGVQYKPPQ